MTPIRRRKRGPQDGVFKKNGWWWLDYYDQDGRRHRRKASVEYETAKALYRQTMAAIARGEVTGIREEGTRVRAFVETRYWPAVQSTLAPEWAVRSRGILDALLAVFGEDKLARSARKISSAGTRSAGRR
jgi:hypothetical protein